MDAGVRGVFFGIAQVYEQISQFGILYGVPLAMVPFIHVLVVRKLIDKLVPADWGLFGKLTKEKGNFRTAQTRLVVHAEAVSALRGGQREQDILQSIYDKVVECQRLAFATLIPHFTAHKAGMGYGLHLTIMLGICGPVIYNQSMSGKVANVIAQAREFELSIYAYDSSFDSI